MAIKGKLLVELTGKRKKCKVIRFNPEDNSCEGEDLFEGTISECRDFIELHKEGRVYDYEHNFIN